MKMMYLYLNEKESFNSERADLPRFTFFYSMWKLKDHYIEYFQEIAESAMRESNSMLSIPDDWYMNALISSKEWEQTPLSPLEELEWRNSISVA